VVFGYERSDCSQNQRTNCKKLIMSTVTDVKNISFVGRDAVGIQTLAERLMDVVFPPDEREEDEDIRSEYDTRGYDKARVRTYTEVWNVWVYLWRLLNNKVDVDDAGARNQRADEVQVLGDRFRVAWCRAVGIRSTAGLYVYVHIMHASTSLTRSVLSEISTGAPTRTGAPAQLQEAHCSASD
jgi:hypothetical protein